MNVVNIHQVEGTIVAMEGPGSGTELKSEWLQFTDLYNFSMVGNGKINGRGKRWWGQACRATSNVCFLQSLDKIPMYMNVQCQSLLRI